MKKTWQMRFHKEFKGNIWREDTWGMTTIHAEIEAFIAQELEAQRKKDLEEIMFETSFDFRAWQVVAKEKQGVWLRLKDLKKTILKLN